MEKVEEFKKTLNTVETLLITLTWIIGVGGLLWLILLWNEATGMSAGIKTMFVGSSFFALVGTLFVLHIFRVLGLGVGFTLVEIAENTRKTVKLARTALVPKPRASASAALAPKSPASAPSHSTQSSAPTQPGPKEPKPNSNDEAIALLRGSE